MKEPLTEELLKALLDAPDPMIFADEYRLRKRSLSDYLEELLDAKDLNRAEVVREANINNTFGYEIFTGRKERPSRNYVLRIAFAMELTLQETNRALQAAKVNELYCKNRRDAIIIFCIDKGYGLQKTDEELYRFNEETIC